MSTPKQFTDLKVVTPVLYPLLSRLLYFHELPQSIPVAFAFEKLLVYQKPVDFADQICSMTEIFPRGHGFLSAPFWATLPMNDIWSNAHGLIGRLQFMLRSEEAVKSVWWIRNPAVNVARHRVNANDYILCKEFIQCLTARR
jgi:hypothetical protein